MTSSTNGDLGSDEVSKHDTNVTDVTLAYLARVSRVWGPITMHNMIEAAPIVEEDYDN